MIFVILGTQNKKFTRLLIELESLIKNKVITEKVVAQAGFTEFSSEYMQVLSYISMEEFNNLIRKSDFIITHGGVGSIIDSLKQNKKIIAVPRLKEYNEHINNHQQQIVKEFAHMGYILESNVLDLKEKIIEIKNFKPKKYKSNNSRIIKNLENYIEAIK